MAKQIIIAIVVVIALAAAYVFFTEPEPVRDTVASWRLAELDQFDRFALNLGDQQLVIDKGVNGWRIQEPLSFDADSDQMEAVEGLFADTGHRLVVDEQKEASPNNLTRYGFDEDTLHVTLYNHGEAAASFVVGSTEETPSGDERTWIRPDDSDTLYRVNRNLREVLDKALDDWRNHVVLSLSREERDALDAIDITYADRNLRLEKTTNDEGESTWQLVEPSDVDVDPELISRWVRQLRPLNAADFADDVDLEQTGLEDPLNTVTLHIGEDTAYHLEFGSSFTSTAANAQEQMYARLDNGPVFAVSTRDAERFMKRTGDFRPRRVLELDRDAVRQIDVVDRDGAEMRLVRNDLPEDAEEGDEATWRMEQPEAIDPVNMSQFRRMLTNLVEVDATTFDDDITSADAGLDNPERTLTVTLGDGSQVTMAIGNPLVANLDDETSADHYARVGNGSIFVLQDYKSRNLLQSADDLRPEDEAAE